MIPLENGEGRGTSNSSEADHIELENFSELIKATKHMASLPEGRQTDAGHLYILIP